MTTQPEVKPAPSPEPTPAPKAPEPTPISTTDVALKKLIAEEVAKETAKHTETFKKAQSAWQRSETKYKQDLADAQALSEGLDEEDKASIRNVREIINDTADTIGESLNLTASQIDVLKGARTMKHLKATAKEFQTLKPSRVEAEKPEAEPDDIIKRLEAMGANRGATPGDAGAGTPAITDQNADKLWMDGKITDEQYRLFLRR